MVRLGSVFVEALASRVADCEAGWLLGHPTDRPVVDQGVERIGQGTIVQARSGRGLKLLERNTGCPVLRGQALQSFQHGYALKGVRSR
jgi:hypothetical protein